MTRRRLGLLAFLVLASAYWAAGAARAAERYTLSTFLDPRGGLTDTEPSTRLVVDKARITRPDCFRRRNQAAYHSNKTNAAQ